MNSFAVTVQQRRRYAVRGGSDRTAYRRFCVFQYSNTYAVFLLICLVILFYRKRRAYREYIKAVILAAGIVFCGSRSVFRKQGA